MRKKIIAGNWKMNKDIHETAVLVGELKKEIKTLPAGVGAVLCPPFTSLVVAKTLMKDTVLRLGAQNMSDHGDGAYTGEVSARMLAAVGCEYVILGHSERRQYYGETDQLINGKVKAAVSANLIPVVCVGETLAEREAGVTEQIVGVQVRGVLHELEAAQIQNVVIAYEPVWAIGTGKTATPQQANDVHRFIRKIIAQLTSWTVAEQVVIQYGGSMNAGNAASLLAQPDIDGGLIGGASLKSDAFGAIVRAAVEAAGKGS